MTTAAEYAELSASVYADNGVGEGLPPNWTLYEGTKSVSSDKGFFGAAYRNGETGEIVVAYRGTTPTDTKDLVTDLQIGLDKKPQQYDEAKKFYQEVSDKAAEKGLQPPVLTGHSLGGALAQLVAADAETQTPATTFNAPGVKGIIENKKNEITVKEGDNFDYINNYNAVFDPVSKVDNQIGNVHTVSVSSVESVPDWAEPIIALAAGALGIGAYLFSQHGIDNMANALKKQSSIISFDIPMPAAKHFDPVLGIDIHIVAPAGPIPHPFIGILLDLIDYIPIIGSTVKVNGVHRAQITTGGITLPPHFPIGGTFIRLIANECDMFMGSSKVYFDSLPASYIALPALSCQFFGKAPLVFVIPIPGSPPVYYGGSPTISLMGILTSMAIAGFAKGLGKLAKKSGLGQKIGSVFQKAKKKAFKNMKPGFVKCKVLKAEPVNSVTGEVVVEQQDFSLPGHIPLEWNRNYNSGSEYSGCCGNGWETPADARLEIDDDGIVTFYDGSPGGTVFTSLPLNGQVKELIDGAVLDNAGYGEIKVQTKEGTIYYFPNPEINEKQVFVKRIGDRNNNHLVFTRNNGNLIAIADKTDRRIEIESYNGKILSMTLNGDENEKSRMLLKYEYDKSGNLITAYDAMNEPYQFFYENNILIQHKDRNELSFYYEYDENNKCIHAFGDDGLYDYTFEYSIGQTIITNSLGYTTTLQYDDDNLPFKEIDHKGNITTYEYDEFCRTSAVTDPAGNKTEYEYDENGNLIKLVRPDGSEVLTAFDEDNNPVKITDPGGNVWNQEWNDKKLLTAQKTPTGAQSKYEYNQNGDMVRATDPLGAATSFAQDNYGNIKRITDALGSTTYYELDALGNVTSITDPAGSKSVYIYDSKSRLIKTQYPSGTNIFCKYDLEDNLIEYKDESGNITKLEYTGVGEVARRIQPDGSVVEYKYDTEEQLTKIINERGESFKLIRDHQGRVIEEIDYWGNSRKYEYDIAGNLTGQTDPLGKQTAYEYDPLNRLKAKIFPDNKKEEFVYDISGNLIEHKNEHVQVQRVFDEENRIIEEASDNFKLINKYDLNGNRIERISSHGNVAQYTYDAVGNVIAIQINNDSPVKIRRNNLGLPVKETLSGRIDREYQYDIEGRLTGQKIFSPYHQLSERRYEYDPVGNLTAKLDSLHGNTFFTYDPKGQVVEFTNPENKIKKIVYDPAGNSVVPRQRLSNKDGTRESYHDEMHYKFDPAGNLIERKSGNFLNSQKSATFEWDDNDMLVSAVNESGQRINMAYDAQGRRISKSADDKKTEFCWDGDSLLSDNVNGEGAREFIYYPGTFEPLAIIDKEKKVYYFHNDVVGLPNEVTDDQGNIVWSANYGVFGKVEKLRVNEIDNPLRFQGQYYDEEIGLCYNRFRYFDPHSGTFISQDPLGLVAGVNLYQYAPNVWGWIDPLGLSCKGKASKNADLLRTGGNNTTVNVKTKGEADKLLKEAFPDYQKVKGVGPQDASGIRKKRKLDRFKQGGAYHKDYAIDSQTGRVRGHGANNAHGEYPHINIKRKDRTRVIINIVDE